MAPRRPVRPRRAALGALLGVMLAAPGVARAATANGVLITGVVCVTHTTVSGYPYAVSYCATALVTVGSPCTLVRKSATPLMQGPGGTVTYRIYVINCSSTNTSFNINVTDRLPDLVGFDAYRGDWVGGAGGTWSQNWGADNVTWTAGTPAGGQTAPCYLRFVLDSLSPMRSALVIFSVTVL